MDYPYDMRSVPDPEAPREHPMPGNVLMRVLSWDEDYPDKAPLEIQGREETGNLDDAHVITSAVEYTQRKMHRPVLDIDVPAQLIPSTTKGHHHLLIDAPMTWEQYQKLMAVLVEVGVVEYGYVRASQERGYSSARLPWVKKDAKVKPEPTLDEMLTSDPVKALRNGA